MNLLNNPVRCIVSLLIAAVLSACSGNQATPVEQGNQNQVLHVGNGGEPAGIDPHTTTGMPEFHIQMAVFEGLVSKHPETLEPTPGIAESWAVSDDGLVYRFKLRDNAKWSNGEPLVAEDIVWSWKRALLPQLGNQYAYSLYVIDQAEAFHKGQITDFSQVGVKAIDDRTLEVRLHSPAPYFLQLLDHHSMYPVPPEVVGKFGAIDDRASNWTRPENFVGNGPYTLKEWVPNQVLVVEKNEHYWDAENVTLKEIHFYPVEQGTTEERMFRAGQLHVTNIVPIEKIESYRQKNSPVWRNHPYFGTYFYGLNTDVEPLNDPRVRKALAMSIDREAIVEQVSKGGQKPAFALTPPGTAGYTPEARVEYNVEKARQLLAEAGYPNGKGFPKLEILFNTLEDHQKIAVAIQQMWKQALGIDVTLQNQDWKVFLANQRTQNYQIARASWIGDYYDPSTFLDMFITDGGNNKTGWSNARYDELIARASRTADQQERYRLFQEAEQILMDEVPIIPIYTYATNKLVSESVKGWHDNIMDYHPYKYLSLESGSASGE